MKQYKIDWTKKTTRGQRCALATDISKRREARRRSAAPTRSDRTSSLMGRQALIAAICWLTLSSTYGDSVKDNASAESSPRLYRNVPVGVYASAAPHSAYSFQFVSSPNTAASQPVPVKLQPLTYLKDSYGKFLQSPQMLSYKATFPQQYVTLQPKLPEHLAQPLVAAATPNFQFKQSAPQMFFGAPFRIPNLQGPTPTPINHFPTFGQLYAGQVQSLAPTSNVYNQAFSYGPQKPTLTSNPVITNTNEQYRKEPNFQVQDSHHASNEGSKIQQIKEINHSPQSEVKFQRIQEQPEVIYGQQEFQRLQDEPTTTSDYHSSYYATKSSETPQSHYTENSQASHHQKPQIQASPAKTIVTYVDDNGKKTSVKLDSTPTHPLLDLTLLEPLTFDNPLVPQVQHFLPRINQATYKKLPQADIDGVKNYQKEFVVSKTMSYDSDEDEKPKPAPKKKQKKTTYSSKSKNVPKKTTVTYHETLDDSPEVTYEINAPNYKETIKQKAVSYNKKTESEPVHVTYGSKSQSDPVTYSFSRSAKEPLHIKVVHYSSEEPAPLVYNFKPGDHISEEKSTPHSNKEHVESSQESGEDDSSYNNSSEQYNDRPKSSEEYERPSHKEESHHHKHSHSGENNHYKPLFSGENHHHKHSSSGESHHPKPTHGGEHHHFKSSQSGENNHHKPSHNAESHYHKPSHKDDGHHHHKPSHSGESYHHKSQSGDSHYHKPSHSAESQHQQPYREQSHQNKPSNGRNHHSEPRPTAIVQKEKSHQHRTTSAPQHEIAHHNQPQLYPGTSQFSSNFAFQPITKEYEEDIRLVAPNAQIKVDPNQHVHFVKSTAQPHAHTQSHPQDAYVPQRVAHPSPPPRDHPRPSPTPQSQVYYSTPHSQPARYNEPAPHIHEKSKQVIIQDESPDERHMLREQMRQEVINQEENSEDDFEKAYQESAQGFPAYNFKDAEKDIFDPESYGVPPDHLKFDIKNTPFQQYQEEGDEFPESTRAIYKDARDKMKEDYYSDYSISKPESLLDRYNNKLGYYKLYKQQKPDYFSEDEGENVRRRNNKQSEKFTVAPSFQFAPATKDSGSTYYGHHKPKQQLYEYDFSQGKPKEDSSAFASGSLHRYRSKTNFVEPQFQYGFEPLAIPQLLDSELAAMASNDSPESKPATRKKIYKENWYIKKTSTSAGAPAS